MKALPYLTCFYPFPSLFSNFKRRRNNVSIQWRMTSLLFQVVNENDWKGQER